MAKEKTIVNGYTIPGGYSGVAVRRACETVLANPGITQKQLLAEAVMCSGLAASTAGWIVSPGNPWNGKSPATRLWDRRVVPGHVFRCYPTRQWVPRIRSSRSSSGSPRPPARRIVLQPSGISLRSVLVITSSTRAWCWASPLEKTRSSIPRWGMLLQPGRTQSSTGSVSGSLSWKPAAATRFIAEAWSGSTVRSNGLLCNTTSAVV